MRQHRYILINCSADIAELGSQGLTCTMLGKFGECQSILDTGMQATATPGLHTSLGGGMRLSCLKSRLACHFTFLKVISLQFLCPSVIWHDSSATCIPTVAV